jgi:hypothetical protein
VQKEKNQRKIGVLFKVEYRKIALRKNKAGTRNE